MISSYDKFQQLVLYGHPESFYQQGPEQFIEDEFSQAIFGIPRSLWRILKINRAYSRKFIRKDYNSSFPPAEDSRCQPCLDLIRSEDHGVTWAVLEVSVF